MAKNFSDIQVKKANGKTVKGFGSVMVGNAFKVNFTIMEGSKGLFVKLPSHKGKDDQGGDKWYDDVYITDEDVRKEFQREVLKMFQDLNGNAKKSQPADDDGIPF